MPDRCVNSTPTGPRADTADVSLDDWRRLLDYLVSPEVAPALVPEGHLDGLALRATDQRWASLDGAMVEGPSEALAMVVAGRPAALDDVDGPGVELLRSRMAGTEGGP